LGDDRGRQASSTLLNIELLSPQFLAKPNAITHRNYTCCLL